MSDVFAINRVAVAASAADSAPAIAAAAPSAAAMPASSPMGTDVAIVSLLDALIQQLSVATASMVASEVHSVGALIDDRV